MPLIPVKPRFTPHTDLKDRVNAQSPAQPMPLVHVTEMGYARDILLSGQLMTRRCDVFERELLYFFLGRPAYRLKDEVSPMRQISRYPCVFVVDPARIAPVHVYPFDTGALASGRYSDADPHLAVEDYKLEASHEAALKQLAYAFDTPDDYFEGRLRPNLQDGVPAFHQSTLSYLRIANQANRGINNSAAYDDRASAIEVATDQHLDLKSAVELAILPKQFLEGDAGQQNSELLARLQTLGINTDLYDWQSTRSPADYRAEINGKVFAHVKARPIP